MARHRILLPAIAALLLVAVAPEANGGGGTALSVCGQAVTTDAYFTTDLICTGQDGVIVAAAGVTIDLKGFTLRGDRTSGHHGVDDTAGYADLTVKNGVLRNFDSGVYANTGADGVSISKVTAAGNLATGFRIIGDEASVKSVNASGNVSGIYVSGNLAKIQSAVTAANTASGVLVIGDSAQVKSVVSDGNGGKGIQVGGDDAKVQSSSVSGNVDHGIHVQGDAATIKSNTADANGYDAGASNLGGLGINAAAFTTAPVGSNDAGGNDDPNQCVPASLC